MTHLREAQDENGDLLGVYYFCSRGCWRDSFAPDRLGPATARCRDAALLDPSIDCSGLTEGGGSPGAAAEPGEQYDVHCAECGVLLASPDRQPPVVVNLIERPPLDPVTGAASPAAA